MMQNYDYKLGYTILEHAEIYGHGVWHYSVYFEPVGDIDIVTFEGKGMSLIHRVFDMKESSSSAEHFFKKICRELLDGKYL